ncbi:hypothetical protein HDU98_008578, partial [Podochytrium sp. JEL0797]
MAPTLRSKRTAFAAPATPYSRGGNGSDSAVNATPARALRRPAMPALDTPYPLRHAAARDTPHPKKKPAQRKQKTTIPVDQNNDTDNGASSSADPFAADPTTKPSSPKKHASPGTQAAAPPLATTPAQRPSLFASLFSSIIATPAQSALSMLGVLAKPQTIDFEQDEADEGQREQQHELESESADTPKEESDPVAPVAPTDASASKPTIPDFIDLADDSEQQRILQMQKDEPLASSPAKNAPSPYAFNKFLPSSSYSSYSLPSSSAFTPVSPPVPVADIQFKNLTKVPFALTHPSAAPIPVTPAVASLAIPVLAHSSSLTEDASVFGNSINSNLASPAKGKGVAVDEVVVVEDEMEVEVETKLVAPVKPVSPIKAAASQPIPVRASSPVKAVAPVPAREHSPVRLPSPIKASSPVREVSPVRRAPSPVKEKPQQPQPVAADKGKAKHEQQHELPASSASPSKYDDIMSLLNNKGNKPLTSEDMAKLQNLINKNAEKGVALPLAPAKQPPLTFPKQHHHDPFRSSMALELADLAPMQLPASPAPPHPSFASFEPPKPFAPPVAAAPLFTFGTTPALKEAAKTQPPSLFGESKPLFAPVFTFSAKPTTTTTSRTYTPTHLPTAPPPAPSGRARRTFRAPGQYSGASAPTQRRRLAVPTAPPIPSFSASVRMDVEPGSKRQRGAGTASPVQAGL